MITLDTLRTAARSEQPWTALDELVRAELAAGRLTRAIYDDITTLQEEFRKSPDYNEDADDAIGDTLDLLIGFCPAGREYKNPPILPTEEEIAALPRWALVAFAVRCAQRVLPVFLSKWPKAPPIYRTQLTWAIEVSERSAARAGAGEDWAPPAGAIACAAYVCDAVICADRDRGRAVEVIKAMSVAVARFKDKAEDVFDPHTGELFHIILTNTSVAFADGIASSQETHNAAVKFAHGVIRRDFDYLFQLAETQRWDDDTPVPPEVFGPLWPEGPPKGWPPITDVPPRTELVIEGFAREQAAHRVILDDVVNLFRALNRYHITRSGERLTLDQFHSLLPVLVPAEV